ncbi:uncharacterized protein [Antedon mediterranea]|uniref:uncharacterized protein n=1 Tax=Antedon mediterranea TaxID=105859 RepID=UPI003AF85F03
MNINVFSCPKILLTNVRSIRNKVDEFEATLSKYKIDLAVVTETWLNAETENLATIPGYQHFNKMRVGRKGGGVSVYSVDRLIMNHTEHHDQCNFECLWCCITIPNNIRRLKHLYVGAIYYPPAAAGAEQLVSHVIETVDRIRSANHEVPIIILVRKAPIGSSDHVSVLMKPITCLPKNDHFAVKIRPMKDSSMRQFGQWLVDYEWNNVYDLMDTNDKTVMLATTLQNAYYSNFPTELLKMRSTDHPWLTKRVKQLIKQRQKAYVKFGKSSKWKKLRNGVQKAIMDVKKSYYQDAISGLHNSDSSKWHKNVGKLCNLNQKQSFSIPGLNEKETAESINQHFADVCCQLPALDQNNLPAYLPSSQPPPEIYPGQVQRLLQSIKPKKAGHPEDLPAKLLRECAFELAPPITNVFNCALKAGTFPDRWKHATVVPVPKIKGANTCNDLRPISLTPLLARTFETFLVNWIIEDISVKLDSRQFGSRKGASTTHYLISLIDSVLKDTDASLLIEASIPEWVSLDDLDDWCKANNMLPKPSKCHVMTINFLRNASEFQPFTLNNTILECVGNLKLLGVTIQDNMKWDMHVTDIVSKASRKMFALFVMRRSRASVNDLIKVFCCYIRPILEYACPVWHGAITKKLAHKIEAVQKRALRTILGKNYISYDLALEETQLLSLAARRESLVLSFGQGLIKSALHRDMLPPCRKRKLNLRSNGGNLEVPKCKTDRYIVNLLNSK